MRGIKYIGPFMDHSGYGEASRNYILALHRAGVPLTIEARRFEPNPPKVGTSEDRRILQELQTAKVDFDIVIIHLTPDLAPAYAQRYPDKYNISYTVWETSLIHPLWVEACNQMNEVWVPCDWNIEAFKNSGVKVPMRKIHHGIDPNSFSPSEVGDFSLPGVSDDTFVFCSVMQWNARKNPDGLLRSYYSAFQNNEDVRLVLKTYIGRGEGPSAEMDQLKTIVGRIKRDMNLPRYPKISLITESLSTYQMRSLYSFCDAYVSIPHGEGFGLTMLEAGLAGKPVIATGVGGNMEYMSPDNSYPVSYTWDYVAGMGTFNNWYLGNQQWAYPSTVEAAKYMRYVYHNREEAAAKGRLLQKNIQENFSWEVVSKQMIARLEEL